MNSENTIKDIPYIAVGNNELEGKPLVFENDMVVCPHCGKKHKVETGTSRKWDDVENKFGPEKKSNALQFFKCGQKSYICGVENKLMFDHTVINV